MLSINIKELLESFGITEKDIKQREILIDKMHSLSSMLVDEFFDKHLKGNEKLLEYFKYVDPNRVLNSMKEFIVFIFEHKIDIHYFRRMQEIGYMHYSIKLDNASVKYSFFVLNKIVNNVSEVDSLVHENKELILKILSLTEFVILDTTYTYSKAELQSESNSSVVILLNELYSMYFEHKENMSIITDNLYVNNIQHLKIVQKNSKALIEKVSNFMNKYNVEKETLVVLKIDISKIVDTFKDWEIAFNNYQTVYKENNLIKKEQHYDELINYTLSLNQFIDEPLKVFSKNGFLSLNAGIKVIKSINNLFSKRDVIFFTGDNLSNEIIEKIKEIFLSVFSWAIENFMIGTDYDDVETFDYTKRISFNDMYFYVAIKLKPMVNKIYLKEMLTLLLDTLELNFSIKARENSLVEYAQKAEAANKSKDIFLASMSHELRTPINAITGFSQVLIMKKDTPQAIKEYIKKINIAGNNLLELVNTVLDFAKIESGKTEFIPKFSSIYLLLQEVETIMLPLANKKNIDLDIIFDLHLYIMLDPKLFKQVLINLVSNAIKFTPENGKIWLKFSYDNMSKSYHFILCDNGIGISKENQSKLFKAFEQVENIYQKKESGTGLGLVICKNIIENLHNGKLWVESEENKGSCFHIEIPGVSVLVKSETIGDENDKHYLIVETSVQNKKTYTDKLGKDFHLTFTDSNDGAKALLDSNKYDLIILNFYVADGIGSEVLQYIEEEGINIPVILVSSEKGLTIANALPPTTNIDAILEMMLETEDVEKLCDMLLTSEIRKQNT